MVDHGLLSISLKYSESYRPTWRSGRRVRIPTQAAYLSGKGQHLQNVDIVGSNPTAATKLISISRGVIDGDVPLC